MNNEILKQAIEAAEAEIQHTIEDNTREDCASWAYQEGCLLSRKHMQSILGAIPGPDVIAVFPQGAEMDTLQKCANHIAKEFGIVELSPNAGGGWKVTKSKKTMQ